MLSEDPPELDAAERAKSLRWLRDTLGLCPEAIEAVMRHDELDIEVIRKWYEQRGAAATKKRVEEIVL